MPETTASLARVCSWCSRRFCPGCRVWLALPEPVPGDEPPCCPRCRTNLSGATTHTICPECHAAELAKLKEAGVG